MVQTITIYNNKELKEKLKPFIEQKKAIISEDGTLFFKENCEKEVIDILNKYPEYRETVCDIEEYFSFYDGGDWINFIGNEEIQKSDCIDKLIEKTKKDKSIVNKIFELKPNEIDDYIANLIDEQLADIIDNCIKKLQQYKEDIKNGKFEGWN